ncbi:MAG: protein kinase [Chlamydiae bacterium]|nr:protein kinase [Chlamydiota bacterium]
MSTLCVENVRKNLRRYAIEQEDDAICIITDYILQHLDTQKVHKVSKILSTRKIRIIPSSDISKSPHVMIYLTVIARGSFKVVYDVKNLLNEPSDPAHIRKIIASVRVPKEYEPLLEDESGIIQFLASDPESEKYVIHTDVITKPTEYHGTNEKKKDTVKMLMIQDKALMDLVIFWEQGRLTNAYRLKFCLKILEILSYLKSKGIVYGDVKAENFLVVPDPTDKEWPYTLKVTDFGLSSTEKTIPKTALNAFISPELAIANFARRQTLLKDPNLEQSLRHVLFNNVIQYQTHENDAWSAGVLLALLCQSFLSKSTQNKVYAIYSPILKDKHQQIEKIAQIDPTHWLDEPKEMSFEGLISRLLAYDPQKRLPIEAARDLFKEMREGFLEREKQSLQVAAARA